MKVVLALLYDQSGKVLIAQRPEHKSYGGLWEFPGGKVEPNETPEEALRREIIEELGVEVMPEQSHPPYKHENDRGEKLTFYPITCSWLPTKLTLNEHQRALFVDVSRVTDWPLAPPDLDALKYLQM